MTDPHETPGFTPALIAMTRVGGVLLSHEAAYRLALVALEAAGPLIRADQLLRIADDMDARAADVPGHYAGLRDMAAELRAAGQQIQEALR